MKLPIILLGLLAANLAFANSDFQERLRKIKESQRASEKKLVELGIRVRPASETGIAGTSEGPKPQGLFQTHEDNKLRRAPVGKLLFAKTLNRLVVGAEASPAILLIDGGQGIFSELKALGRARPSGTDGRLSIDIDRIVAKSGKVLPVKASALDSSGALGLEAHVFSSKALALAGSMASSFITGLASSQQTQTTNAFGFSQVDPNGRNALLQGVAQTAADQSKRLIEESTQEKPVLVVEPDTEVSIYLDEEVQF